MKKLCILWLCLCCLMATSLPAYASDLSVITEKTLINGVTYRRIQGLYENGWQDIHVIQADLEQPYLKFDVLSHEKGKSYRENPYTAAINADAVATLNADFFVTKSGETNRGSAIGLEIKDGIMRTSPAAYEDMNVLYQTKEDMGLHFNPFTYSFTITAPDGSTAPITVINKYDDLTGIVMYTKDWGEKTNGSAGNVMEVVVEDGVITAKNQDAGPVTIPENGYVLTFDIGINTFVKDNFEVGDPVVLTMSTTPNYEEIQTAVGGGGMILANGKVPDSFSHVIAGTQPRSAVGIDKTGKIMTLVAVDGRRTGAVGMTMTQLGYLMAELGCYNAMNLDGGGSTLMAVKEADGSHVVANTPSDGGKRAVTNSIGILTENLSKPRVSAIRLVKDQDAVFLNTSMWLYAETLDQYGRVMGTVPSDDITWTLLEGSGTVSNDYFRPKKAGKAKIRAKAYGFSDEVSVEVLDTPHRLFFSKESLTLKTGESAVLWLYGTDAKGQSAHIYPMDVQVKVDSSSIASLERNSICANRSGATLITASMGEVTAYCSVLVDGADAISVPKGKALPDPQQASAAITEAGGFRFTVFGNTRTPAKFFDLYIMNGVVNAVKQGSNMNFFVGNNVNTGLLTDLGNNVITADGFSKFTKNGSTFITLKNAYGTTLYNAEKTQLQKLKQAVDELSGGNLFVFLNDHNLSSYDTEITVFKNLMTKAAEKGCNVYVFAGGFVNETILENGVRYITTAGVFPSIGVKPPATNISYVKYYLVTVNGDNVTYETKGILKE